jgi:hypothetical protein
LRRRVYWIIAHAAIVVGFARYLVAPLVDRREAAATDFTVFYTGWSIVLEDPARTYDVDAQRRAQAAIMGDRHFEGGVMTYYYPPHAAVALAPFALLDFESAFRLWTALQIVCAFWLVRWLLELTGLRDRLDRWVVASAIAAFLPLLYALQIGQLSIAVVLALVGFWRAFAAGRDARAALWLLALTAKPQLLPVPLVLLLASGRLRVLGWLCLELLPLAILTTVVLGPRVWLDYPAYAKRLEGFVAGGSHDHMLNLRGFLTRLAGPGHDGPILIPCLVAFAVVTLAIFALFRRAARRGPIRPQVFATGLALALPVNLHLHLQDALAWVVPLAIFATTPRGDARDARRFQIFALSWPLVFALTSAVETARGRLLLVPPQLLLAAVAAAWMVRALDRGRGAPA